VEKLELVGMENGTVAVEKSLAVVIQFGENQMLPLKLNI